VVFLTLFATGLLAEGAPEAKPASLSRATFLPARGVASGGGEPLLPKLTCTGGGIPLQQPKVVAIFWGPTFSNPASPDYTYAQSVIAYRNQLGTSHVWTAVLPAANLGSGAADWFDTTPPPTNVTDTSVRNEVNKYLATHTKEPSTIYEVFLPSTSYSSSGSSTSCGGPSLAYCAYTSLFGSGTTATHYSVQPWASCTGCQVSGWTAAQNQEHFVEHETVDFVTDPNATGCVTIADKCAWSPPPFLLNGFGYQYLWKFNACVK
jgi:hypothetical protein